MNLVQSFLEALENNGDSTLFLDEGVKISFPELAEKAGILGNEIRSQKSGDSQYVAILLPNSIEFAVSFWAVLFADNVVMPLNFMLQPPEFIPLFDLAKPALLLTHSLFKPLVQALLKMRKRALNVIYVDEFLREWQEKQTASRIPALNSISDDPDKPAMLLFTAGTSATPKGALLSHKNILSNLEGCQNVLQITSDDAFLGILPNFHSFGMTTSFLLPLLKGSRTVVLRSIQPQNIIETIQRERISTLIMVPPLFGLLLKFPGIQKADFSSIRMTVSGGCPLSPVMEEMFPKLTGKFIFNGYGLTEASPVVSVNHLDASRKGSIGRPLHNVAVSIHDEQGTPLPAGRQGEIYVRGDNVMLGYLNAEEDTNKALTPDRMLRTGDMGYLDDNGFLYITGRKKDLIICGGENVHPLEIEMVLNSHPQIEDSAVIGVQDSLRGEHPKAFIKLREGQSVLPGEIRHFCLERLASFKVPREFAFVENFPRNSLGKILKRFLKQETL
ncbi:AMP-binding protein [Candidatus Sumerlaeota bacterium]|nr:AMP-binding protein [Candidatus Sumerlaeota bacterium]